MTKTGPNDASGVVWALGMFFYYLFFMFIYIPTNVLFRFYLHSKSTGRVRVRMSGKDKNGL